MRETDLQRKSFSCTLQAGEGDGDEETGNENKCCVLIKPRGAEPVRRHRGVPPANPPDVGGAAGPPGVAWGSVANGQAVFVNLVGPSDLP